MTESHAARCEVLQHVGCNDRTIRLRRDAAVFVLAVVLGLLVGSCVSVPLAPLELDQTAKQFQPLPDRGQLYIIRPLAPGVMLTYQVVIDGFVVGALAPRTYFVVPLSPGAHTVAVYFPDQRMSTLTVEAGRNYFMRVTHWLYPVEEADGRAAVLAATRAQGFLVP